MRIGVSGHQNIEPLEARLWVDTVIRSEFLKLPEFTTGLSCLAAGADQLFALAVINAESTLEAVVPCRDYLSAFKDDESRALYIALYEKCALHHHLAFDLPSEEAFLTAGKTVVDLSDLMFFIWDGQPAAGKGGTEDIFEYARAASIPYVHFNPVNYSVERSCD